MGNEYVLAMDAIIRVGSGGMLRQDLRFKLGAGSW